MKMDVTQQRPEGELPRKHAFLGDYCEAPFLDGQRAKVSEQESCWGFRDLIVRDTTPSIPERSSCAIHQLKVTVLLRC